jgi:hypothetical protein
MLGLTRARPERRADYPVRAVFEELAVSRQREVNVVVSRHLQAMPPSSQRGVVEPVHDPHFAHGHDSNELAYQSDGLDFGVKELQRVIASL